MDLTGNYEACIVFCRSCIRISFDSLPGGRLAGMSVFVVFFSVRPIPWHITQRAHERYALLTIAERQSGAKRSCFRAAVVLTWTNYLAVLCDALSVISALPNFLEVSRTIHPTPFSNTTTAQRTLH
jgi:hypothetical protein